MTFFKLPLRKPQSSKWTIFFACATLFMCSQFFRVSNAVIAPKLQEDLSLSPQSLGLLGAAFFYSFALMQIPLAFFLDRFGARWTMAVLSFLSALGAWIFALADGFEGAFIGRLLIGIGMAANLMGPMKLFTQWFELGEFATLSGIMMSMGTVGNMLATTPLAFMEKVFGWRTTFFLIGCLTAGLTLVFFFLVRERPERTDSSLSPSSTRTTSSLKQMFFLLRSRSYWVISYGTFFRYGTLVGIQGLWAGPYLIQVLGFSPVEAGNILLFLNAGLIMGSPVGGWLSDKAFRSRKKVVLAGLLAMTVTLGLLSLNRDPSRILELVALFALFGCFSGFGTVMYAHIKESMPTDMTGMALSSVNLFTMLGGAFFQQGLGWVLNRLWQGGASAPSAFQSAFLLCSLGTASAFFLYLMVKDTRVGAEMSPQRAKTSEEKER